MQHFSNIKCKTAHFFDKNVSFYPLDNKKQQISPYKYIVSKNVKSNNSF